MLINYLSATGADHHIRKAFIHEQIHTFDEFTIGCNVENIKTFQRDDGNNNIVPAFNSVKLTLITNVILYYEFLQDDNQETLADNPVNWVLLDFKRWRRNPPVSTNAATVTTAATAAAVTQKEEDDSFLSWRRSKKDEKGYPILNNDREFTEWRVKFVRKIHSDEMYQMIDINNIHASSIHTDSDQELWDKQTNFFSTVLEYVLQTKEGKRLTRKHTDNLREVWRLHEKHSKSSATASSICTGLSQELAKLKISEYNNPTEGLDTFDSHLTHFNKISPNKMPDNLAIMLLEAATSGNSDLLSAWTQRQTIKEELNPGGPAPTYDEF